MIAAYNTLMADRQNKSILLCCLKVNIPVLKGVLRLWFSYGHDAPFFRMSELLKVQPHRHKEEPAWRLIKAN